MAFQQLIQVANASAHNRSSYVDVELEELGVPAGLDADRLQLSRLRDGQPAEEIPIQVDFPFGLNAGHRILVFFAAHIPPGSPDYSRPTAEFLLTERERHAEGGYPASDLLRVRHFPLTDREAPSWVPSQAVRSLELSNGGDRIQNDGLRVRFSLVACPEPESAVQCAGAATSVLHHRAWRETGQEGAEMLYQRLLGSSPSRETKCGQLTRADFHSLPWERRRYQAESLVAAAANDPEYTLVWSQAGPVRATVSLMSKPIQLRYEGRPVFQPDEVVLNCRLYRILALYPRQEFYIENLIVRPEDRAVASTQRVSLSYDAHFRSFIDSPQGVLTDLARSENVPCYFALWRSFAAENRAYSFAADSQIRRLEMKGPEISWQLQLGRDYRCLHQFSFHAYYPNLEFGRLSEIARNWDEWLLRPLRVFPVCDEAKASTLQFASELDIHALRTDAPVKEVTSVLERSGFRPGAALTDRDRLWGRQALLDRLLDLCAKRVSARLVGPRRAGKTSLLRVLRNTLSDDGYHVLHVSLEGARIKNKNDLAKRLDNNLPQRAPADALQRRLRQEKSVLLIDEVACLETGNSEMFAWLRAVGQQQDVVIIYAGTHWDWYRITKSANWIGDEAHPGSNFGNDVNEVALGPISVDDATQFLLYNTPKNVLNTATPGWILELCGTWPFYLQVMGDAVVQSAREGNRRALESLVGVRELYEAWLLEGWDTVFRGRWRELPPDAQATMFYADLDRLPPVFKRLSGQEREILCNVGLCSPSSGWIEDRPFYDWLNRHRSTLEKEL